MAHITVKMKNIKKVVFIFVLLIVGCKNNNEISKGSLQEKDIINKDFEKIIDAYIIASPIKSFRIIGKSSIESGFSYPSYHLFFKKQEMDTVFSIVQFSSYNNFELEGVYSSDGDETFYRSIENNGWGMYKEKYPLILFDDNGYSDKLIDKNSLIHEIPDSLKAGINNQHVKFIKWDYKIENNSFQKID